MSTALQKALLARGFSNQVVAAVTKPTINDTTKSQLITTETTTESASKPDEEKEGEDEEEKEEEEEEDDEEEDLNSLFHLHVGVWLEAVDPHHRYSKSLMKYFRYWQDLSLKTQNTSTTPSGNTSDRVDFFSWLDFGGGRNLDLPWCPRRVLERRRVKYMNIEERSWFAVEIKNGLLYWKLSGELLHTPWSPLRILTRGHLPRTGTWIFVLSQQQQLYVGQKIKGRLHHSSFTAGAGTLAAGNIRCMNGKLINLLPKSGHYRPDPVIWRNALCEFFSNNDKMIEVVIKNS